MGGYECHGTGALYMLWQGGEWGAGSLAYLSGSQEPTAALPGTSPRAVCMDEDEPHALLIGS